VAATSPSQRKAAGRHERRYFLAELRSEYRPAAERSGGLERDRGVDRVLRLTASLARDRPWAEHSLPIDGEDC
jgi:hypothetical protein